KAALDAGTGLDGLFGSHDLKNDKLKASAGHVGVVIAMRLELHAGGMHLLDLGPRHVLRVVVVDRFGDQKEGAGIVKPLQEAEGVGVGIGIAIVEGDNDRPLWQWLAHSQMQSQVIQADRLVALFLEIAKLLIKDVWRHGQVASE